MGSQVEQGLNMSAKFKDSKIAKLEKAIKDGHVSNPGDIICDTIESLKHCILKHESKEMALRVRITAVDSQSRRASIISFVILNPLSCMRLPGTAPGKKLLIAQT